jgi:LPXTG-motif cell wall-anchored protein
LKTRLAALLVLIGFVLPPAAAAATAGPVFGLRAVGNPKRGYFVYDLSAGSTTTGAVIVSNTGNRTGTVKLYSADGSTGQTTGTVYLTDTKPSRAGAWVTLSRPSVELAPGEVARVPFTVSVPAGAAPGQWVAGIVAEAAASPTTKRSTRKAGVQIRIRNQTIVAVQVDVAGALQAGFTIGGAKTGGQRGFQQVLVHFANTGNVLSKPTGSVTILKGGKPVERLPFAMDTFLPQTDVDYPLLLKKALAPGEYETRVALSFATPTSGQKAISASPPLSVSSEDVKQVFTSAAPTQQPVADSGSSTPWAALVGAAAVVGLLVLLALWLLRRRRRRRAGPSRVLSASAAAARDWEDEPPPAAAEPQPNQPNQPNQPSRPVQPVRPAQPAPVTPAPEPGPAAAETASEPPPAAPPRPAGGCAERHYWEVAYERGTLGDDGVWRFPHRCQNCGLELLATDIADANAQAEQPVGGH